MRLIREGNELVPVLTQIWEAEYLIEQEEQWIPFSLMGSSEPIGEIHASTRKVKLYEGRSVQNRQLVALGKPKTKV